MTLLTGPSTPALMIVAANKLSLIRSSLMELVHIVSLSVRTDTAMEFTLPQRKARPNGSPTLQAAVNLYSQSHRHLMVPMKSFTPLRVTVSPRVCLMLGML